MKCWVKPPFLFCFQLIADKLPQQYYKALVWKQPLLEDIFLSFNKKYLKGLLRTNTHLKFTFGFKAYVSCPSADRASTAAYIKRKRRALMPNWLLFLFLIVVVLWPFWGKGPKSWNSTSKWLNNKRNFWNICQCYERLKHEGWQQQCWWLHMFV